MTRIQQWIAGAVVAILAIVAAGWFLAIAPQKHKASNLLAQVSQQDQSNSGLRTTLSRLTAQMSAVPAEAASVAAIAQKIPSDPAMPDYVRTLTAAAKQTGVELVSIAPSIPVAVAVAAPVVAAPTASTSPAATASAAAPAPAAVPASSLQTIDVALGVQGGYFQIQQFTAALEKLSRSTIVTSISLAPAVSLTAPAPATGASPPPAWKALQASISVSVFMNSSATFTAVPVPTPSTASIPGAAVASAAPSLPSASASN
jgi:Tfp pilus assembly protein PilO